MHFSPLIQLELCFLFFFPVYFSRIGIECASIETHHLFMRLHRSFENVHMEHSFSTYNRQSGICEVSDPRHYGLLCVSPCVPKRLHRCLFLTRKARALSIPGEVPLNKVSYNGLKISVCDTRLAHLLTINGPLHFCCAHFLRLFQAHRHLQPYGEGEPCEEFVVSRHPLWAPHLSMFYIINTYQYQTRFIAFFGTRFFGGK